MWETAQSKRAWASQKSQHVSFDKKITGDQMEHLVKHRPSLLPQEPGSVCTLHQWSKTMPTFNMACPSDSPAFMAVPVHVAVQELKTSLRVAGVTALCREDLAHDKLKGFCGLTRDLAFWHHVNHFFIKTKWDPPPHSSTC